MPAPAPASGPLIESVRSSDEDHTENDETELLTALKEDIANNEAEQQSRQEMNELILLIVIGLLAALILIICTLTALTVRFKRAQDK